MAEPDEYVLGTEEAEIRRLRAQHQTWLAPAHALWARAGLGTGQAVLDLGSGPGFTTLELAELVGPTGRVVARDQSAAFLERLRTECDRRGIRHVETSLGPVEELDLAPASLDAVYARWLFCWLPDPRAVLAAVARALLPGGAVVVQDYLDWAAMKVLPPVDSFRRAVDACMRSWHEAGGRIDVGEVLPEMAHDVGLAVEHAAPVARLGAVGSLEWRWLDDFFATYLPRLAARGGLDAADVDAFRADWARLEAGGRARVHTPTVIDLVLRKPVSAG